MRRISIFGATGSVGEQTIELIERAGGASTFRTVALTGGRNIARLAEQAHALEEIATDCAVSAYDGGQSQPFGTGSGQPVRIAVEDLMVRTARMKGDQHADYVPGQLPDAAGPSEKS